MLYIIFYILYVKSLRIEAIEVHAGHLSSRRMSCLYIREAEEGQPMTELRAVTGVDFRDITSEVPGGN